MVSTRYRQGCFVTEEEGNQLLFIAGKIGSPVEENENSLCPRVAEGHAGPGFVPDCARSLTVIRHWSDACIQLEHNHRLAFHRDF